MANQLFKLLHGLYFANIPTLVWGNPGIGKTSAIRHLGEILNVPCEVKSANKMDPCDLSGLPYTDTIKTKSGKQKKITRYSKPAYVRTLNANKHGILFFDEITTCSPAIQAALLTVIQECKFGEFDIPETTYRIAAGNYNNVVGTHSMSMALLNRCVHIFAKPNIEQFCQGIISDFSNYEYAIINSEEEQLAKKIQYSVFVSDFIRKNPQYLPDEIPDADMSEQTDVAYPTSRSWSNAIRILSVLDKNEPDYIKELLDGCIGIEASKAFRKFIQSNNKFIDLTQFVGNNKEQTFKLPNPDRHDEVMHIMESIVALLKSDVKKYMVLAVRIINILHNKNKKYGDYAPYNAFIMKYLTNIFEIIEKNNLLTEDNILAFNGIKKSNLNIDDFAKIYSMAYNGAAFK